MLPGDYLVDERPGLLADILETPAVLERFDPGTVTPFVGIASKMDNLLLTGEGSSRIFPARYSMSLVRNRGDFTLATAGATEAAEMDLSRTAVLAVSNSGRTAELVRLCQRLKESRHPGLMALTAASDSLLAPLASLTHILGCGRERAVAATKSVAEQALFAATLAARRSGRVAPDGHETATGLRELLRTPVSGDLILSLAGAQHLYFAGRDNGVAEELSLKCNEILRKPSRYLEGTFLLHGVEEVMKRGDLLVLIDPFPGTERQIGRILGERTGIGIITIGPGPSSFPGVRHPETGRSNPFLQLAAGWVLLALAGIHSGIDIDNPIRARKVGNGFAEENDEEGIRVLT